MDTISVKDLIESKFGNRFDLHPNVNDDFNELVVGSGMENKIIKRLIILLEMIVELKDIDYGTKWMERLKEYDNMYSLHLKVDSMNYRLLFSKKQNGKFFLHLFHERSGKKDTSYDKHVQIAIKRRDS